MKKYSCFLLCLIFFCMTFLLVGCDIKMQISGPEKALNTFEKAFNERDLDGIVKIFKPSQQAEIKLQLKLAQGFAGIAGNIAGLNGLEGLFTEDIIAGFFGVALEDYYIDIQIISEKYNENKTQAIVTIKIITEKSEETDTFKMVKISNVWYFDEDIKE